MNEPDVAVSCSHASRRWAEKIAGQLEAEQFVVWLDTTALKPGEDWNLKITQAIGAARAVVLVIDDRPPDVWQRAQWSAALEASWNKPELQLVPILLGDAEIPSFLAGRQALRVRDPKNEWSEATRELVSLLRGNEARSEHLIVIAEEDRSKRATRLRYIDEATRAMEKTGL